jgi:hypothetical protein
MAKGYSDELRQQVIDFINEGNTVRQAAEKFGVSPSFAAKTHKKHVDQPEAQLFTEVQQPQEDEMPVDDGSVTALDLADVIGVSKRAISDYAERGIIVKTGRNRFESRSKVTASIFEQWQQGAAVKMSTCWQRNVPALHVSKPIRLQ